MASRVRASASVIPSSARGNRTELPPYEPAQFILSAEAQYNLNRIIQGQDWGHLDDQNSEAIARVTNTALELNERLADRRTRTKTRIEKIRQKKQQDDTTTEDDYKNGLERLEESVGKITDRADASMRKLIDTQENVKAIHASITSTMEKIQSEARIQATQPEANIAEDGEEEYPEIIPTDPMNSTQTIPSAQTLFKSYLDEGKLRYQNKSLEERYADNEDYTNFRGLVHGALHTEDGIPLPPVNQWFQEGKSARPGLTQAQDDEEEDIQMTRAVTSTRCPITLQEFKDPVSSKKCRHTFEASAIKEMITKSTILINQRANGRRGGQGDQAVQCPVGSCDKMLCMDDLGKDVVVERQIRRLQRARALQDDETMNDIDEGETAGESERQPALIEDDVIDVDDVEMDQPVRKQER